ncbi:hypothetical protein LguiA_016753 [Lonicera macranthoides]
MDSAKEIMTVIGPKDLAHIVKGKRTKRQRPQSPIPNFTITTDYINNINSSPANSAHEFADTTTEEDQDTAKCLLLLSQGPSPDSPNIINYNINHDDDLVGTYKFTSKKYIETSTTGNGKAGIYVYECKTCNRTFPSFQALGGHRASHKKPKATNPEDRKRPLSDEEEPPQFKHNNYISSGLSLQLSNRPLLYTNTNNNNNNIKSSSKVHECAICGAEFTSGQALGGHMRRHRGPVAAPAAAAAAGANTALSLSPSSPPIGIDHQSHADSNKRAKYGLCLDLNLPAAPEPEEEQPAVTVNNQESTKTAAAAKLLGYNSSKQQNQTPQHHHQQQQQQQQKQQSPLVLSAAPTLVDCHY